jgi:hypothetical protein
MFLHDLLYLILFLAFFVIAALYAQACEKL